MRGMEDKQIRKEILDDLIAFLNDKMAGALSGDKEPMEMEVEMASEEMGPMESEMKEPSVVEIEIEKKPLSEAMSEDEEDLYSDEDEDLSRLAERKYKKEKQMKE